MELPELKELSFDTPSFNSFTPLTYTIPTTIPASNIATNVIGSKGSLPDIREDTAKEFKVPKIDKTIRENKCVVFIKDFDSSSFELPMFENGKVVYKRFTTEQIKSFTRNDIQAISNAYDSSEYSQKLKILSLIALAENCVFTEKDTRVIINRIDPFIQYYGYDELIQILKYGYVSAFLHMLGRQSADAISNDDQKTTLAKEGKASVEAIDVYNENYGTSNLIPELKKVAIKYDGTILTDVLEKYIATLETVRVEIKKIVVPEVCAVPFGKPKPKQTTTITPECDLCINYHCSPSLIIDNYIYPSLIALKKLKIYRN